ncbi:hypothetical protein SARC_09433 [Sphaeroforma arctica JP610]|uniref:Fibronectin type-III domain-containing protein n=1 Tax=Sphaeroforma arctica JP610 TaxID=667725 RepID=A0A0L0FNU9_9EUKA|nr:hypothetical protein SARC_09433 [Sphaeroforma arctica JP610]KNC78126.1 hypothetical protein SARC_09433 [Sphaeroforma arctica JP610]|eukprot:XP_014152028.1 hypothetical protein SARC_09433 [Sphaeroforma arctica JP610]
MQLLLTTLVLCTISATLGEQVCFGADPNCQFPPADCKVGTPSPNGAPPACDVAGTTPIPTWSTFVQNLDDTYTLSVFSDTGCTQQVFTSTTTAGVCTLVEVPLVGAQFYQVTADAASSSADATVTDSVQPSSSSVGSTTQTSGEVTGTTDTAAPTSTATGIATESVPPGNGNTNTGSVTMGFGIFTSAVITLAAAVLSA